MGYYISLAVLILVYILTICLMKKFTNTKITNLIFVLLIFSCYLALTIKVYVDEGLYNWNLKQNLPTANVSPFMFFSSIFYFIMPKKIKTYYLTLISLLIFGMFMSPTLSIISRITTGYHFVPQFLLDYVPHFAISLWGIYIVKSKQIDYKKEDCLIGGSIIVTVAVIMMLLNILFDTCFFGLSFNSDYNIYNMVLVDNAYLSAFIYFIGLIGILVIGFFIQKLINIKTLKQ